MSTESIQAIFKEAYAAYEKAHNPPPHVRKAARALMRCRTAELGGHMQECPDRHYERHWYNSCRHRSCPQCNRLRLNQWLVRQTERLVQCGHYHMIFTPPHELCGLWLWNTREMTDLLFTAVRDTLFEFFTDTRHIGAKPGIIATLHTWSQTLILHPHIHCLITEGGMAGGRWVCRTSQGYLLPVRAVMAVFRGKYLAYIDDAITKGKLTLPDDMTEQQWKNLRNKLGRVKWNVHIRERYEYGKGILIYLSRYIRGGAISNKRIIAHTGAGVTFRHRLPGTTKQGTMQLPNDSFIKRYLQHVPEPNTKVVRSYGLYASTAREELTHCRTLFGQTAPQQITEPDWQSYCEKKGDEHPECCPVCGQRLVRTRDIPRPRMYTYAPWREELPMAA